MKAKVLIPVVCSTIAAGTILLIASASIVMPTIRMVGKLLAGT